MNNVIKVNDNRLDVGDTLVLRFRFRSNPNVNNPNPKDYQVAIDWDDFSSENADVLTGTADFPKRVGQLVAAATHKYLFPRDYVIKATVRNIKNPKIPPRTYRVLSPHVKIPSFELPDIEGGIRKNVESFFRDNPIIPVK